MKKNQPPKITSPLILGEIRNTCGGEAEIPERQVKTHIHTVHSYGDKI
jgi:hypothetical protein